MTRIDDTVRHAVHGLADQFSSPADPPASLGQRALTAVSRKRRRALVGIPTAVVAVGAVVAAVVVAIPENPFPELRQPLAAAPDTPVTEAPKRYVVASYTADYTGRRYVLDPSTSTYRKASRQPVATSPNLRYALLGGLSDPTPDREKITYTIEDTTTGRTVYEVELGVYPTASWSPDGRWIAFANSTGPNMEERHIDEVRLLDVTTGDTCTLDLEPDGATATELLSWSADSKSLFFAADSTGDEKITRNAHVRLFVDGTVKVLRGDWPLDHRVNSVMAGTNHALLLPSSDERGDWIILDLATGKVVDRYRPAVSRPGHPGAEGAWGVLNGDQLITVKGTDVLATDARTGTSKRVAILPETAVAITLAPAPKSAKSPAAVFSLDGK